MPQPLSTFSPQKLLQISFRRMIASWNLLPPHVRLAASGPMQEIVTGPQASYSCVILPSYFMYVTSHHGFLCQHSYSDSKFLYLQLFRYILLMAKLGYSFQGYD